MPDLIYGLARTVVNPTDMYFACKEIDGYASGGTFPIVAKRINNFYWVYDRQNYYEPLDSYDKILETLTLNLRLQESYASIGVLYWIQITFHMFESIYNAPSGVVTLPKPTERPKGIHAVAVIGWNQAGESLVFRNSWGARWGNKGNGTISREYLDKHMVEIWISRNCRVGPSRWNYDRLENATSNKEYSKAWMLENHRWKRDFKHNGRKHRLIVYETLSVQDGRALFICEIRNGFGLRLGWLHLVEHLPASRFIIKELYVFPSFRRLGYGTILESWALDAAQRWNVSKMEIYFHEADAQLSLRTAGRIFGEKRGYTWKWKNVKHPRLVAIGEKAI